MKFLITLSLCFLYATGFAQQPDYAGLPHAVADFDKALETRDTVALKWLLNDKVNYGHSNGWIENKKELIADLYNGMLVYKKITATKPELTVSGNVVAARSIADIDAFMEGRLLSFKLKVLQVWIWENEHWTLFARQSVSVPNDNK
jgi:hypothetical protein